MVIRDRPATRRAFAATCAACLQQGVGLIVVDIVTERKATLRNELKNLLLLPDAFSEARTFMLLDMVLCTVCPGRIKKYCGPSRWKQAIQCRPLPFWSRRGPVIQLGATYEEARTRWRL